MLLLRALSVVHSLLLLSPSAMRLLPLLTAFAAVRSLLLLLSAFASVLRCCCSAMRLLLLLPAFAGRSAAADPSPPSPSRCPTGSKP